MICYHVRRADFRKLPISSIWKVLNSPTGFRLLGVLLSYLASNKRFRLTVDTVDFLVVRGIVLQLHQV